MAKNVMITEDGSSKTIADAARIRTALDGGGTCDWIPKDDVPLQELTVTEDGVYNPEEGYYGFSQVTAEGVGNVVEGELVEKTVTKNGTYNIIDENGSPYGYSKIVVNVDTSSDSGDGGSGGGGSPVVGKDEDGNDNMVEEDEDGNIVMTALPTEIKVIIPPTKLEYNRYEEIDYSGISVYAYISKMIHWLGTTTTAISEGSTNNTISIGGNNVSSSVGDGVLYAPDRTGANDIQLVWDGAKWIKPGNYSAEKVIWKSDKYPTGKIPFEELAFPIKRMNSLNDDRHAGIIKTYNETEITISPNIIYLGSVTNGKIEYIVYASSYKLYCGSTYTIGREQVHIPGPFDLTDETITEVSLIGDGTMATFKNTYSLHLSDMYINSSGVVIHPYVSPTAYNGYEYYDRYTIIAASKSPDFRISVSTYYSGVASRVIASQDLGISVPSGIGISGNTFSPEYKTPSSTGYFRNGQTVYYTAVDVVIPKTSYENVKDQDAVMYNPYYSSSGSAQSITGETNDLLYEYGYAAWVMVYGDQSETSEKIKTTLPVQWKRPGDGKILETTFTAWMKDDGETSTSPEQSGGDQ